MYTKPLEGGINLRKYLLMILMSTLLMVPVAHAHTADKGMLFTDVPATTPNLQEIMVLHSVGLLGYNGVDMALNRTENLSRKDFAGWVGGFFNLEGSTIDEYAQSALKEEYVSSLDGDITYKEINMALFHQKLELENADATLTKEEYIQFITTNLDTDMGEHSLLQMGGFSYGPTGTIEEVISGDDIGLVIEGKTYMLSGHPRIFADATEPESWVGQTLEQSILTTNGSHHHGHEAANKETATSNTLQYIQISSAKQETTEVPKEVENDISKNEQPSTDAAKTPLINPYWLIGSIILIIVLLSIMMLKRKK